MRVPLKVYKALPKSVLRETTRQSAAAGAAAEAELIREGDED